MSYAGVVKSFNPERGWGHIECEDTFAHFGKDIFLLRSQLKGVILVQKGVSVTFNLTDNGRGPEATDVQVTGGGPPVPSVRAAAAPAIGNGMTPIYMGNVKSFNPNSGWGHIMCEQTEQLYGKDMFFMKSQLPGGTIQKGTTVQFSVMQGMKGPEAKNITPVGGGCLAAVPMPMGCPKGCGKGIHEMNLMFPSPVVHPKVQMAMVGCGGPEGCGGCGNPHTVYFGTVKSFKDEKGWGHISCTQTQAIYGKDMFVLRSALNGAAVKEGDNVQFSVTLGLKGPEASNVRVMGQVDEQQIYTGTTKMFNQEKGWGFITCDDTHRLFGKDIFLHKKELGGHVPNQGDAVQFQVSISPEGRPEATGVNFGGGGYVAWKAEPVEVEEEEGWAYTQGSTSPQIPPRRKGLPGPTQRAGPYVQGRDALCDIKDLNA